MSETSYRAFISYCHADEHWARWLHRKLESYRVPKRVASRTGASARTLRPIFRDRDELASGADLSAKIQEALQSSEALLVICSRAAAGSEWVCREIEFFIAQHGDEHVLCLIVDSFDRFPSPLAGREPLAADARATGDGRDRARLKLIAGLLGVGFDELVQRDRQQRRIAAAYRAGALSAAMALAVGATLWFGGTDPCPDPEPRLAGVWDNALLARLAAAFAAIDVPYALESAGKVSAALDDYARQWRAMHVSACTATRVDGAQSDALLDKRMMCLDERLLDTRALVARLIDVNSRSLERATEAVHKLRPLEGCANTAVLAASYPPPPQEISAELTGVSQRVADARAALAMGQLDSAGTLLTDVLPEVERLDYPPLSAASFDLQGQIQAELADSAMIASFEQALAAAARARNDSVSAEIWLTYVLALIESLGDLPAAEKLLLAARIAVARLESDHRLVATLSNVEGALALRQGRLGAARAAMSRALELAELAERQDHSRNPKLKSNLATVLKDLAEFDAARELALEAYQELVSEYGAQHPMTTEPLVTLSSIEEDLGNPASALGYLSEVLALRRGAYGDNSETVALTLRAVGWQQKELGRFGAARESLTKSLEIYQGFDHPPRYQIANVLNALGDLDVYEGEVEHAEQRFRESISIWGEYPDNPNVAIPLTNLGSLLNRVGNPAEALTLCRRALTLDESALGPDHPDLSFSLTCIGEALIELNRAGKAREPLVHAVELRAHAKSWELAWSQFQLGRALWLEKDWDRALSVIQNAHGALELEPGPDPRIPAAVEGWLREHMAGSAVARPDSK